MRMRGRVSTMIDDHPMFHLVRAWMWWVLVPIFIFLGWHTSVFVVFLWSTYANFSADLGVYEAAKARREAAS